MKYEGHTFDEMITYIHEKRSFRMGQRGICVDFKWDIPLKKWIVTVPRADIFMSATSFEFDCSNNLVLKDAKMNDVGMIFLGNYESIKPLVERI